MSVASATEPRPTLRLLPKRDGRARAGHPWVYSNEIAMDAAAKALAPGGPVALVTGDGEALGTYLFNPHTLIAARRIAADPAQPLDAAFLEARLGAALALRDRLYPAPYYRLIHAEADGLPGTVVDRYGDVLAVQTNSAGMDRLLEPLLDALQARLAPTAILLRNESPARALEGLEPRSGVARGAFSGRLAVEENGLSFAIPAEEAQKTGWFYDQRENRAALAPLASGARVLDLYCYAGGFGVTAAKAGAASVLAIDRSEAALAMVAANAALNGVAERVTTHKGEGFAELERLAAEGRRFELVIADPPAFAKSRKDVPVALKAYAKMARLAARLVAPGGFLFAASCSHAVEADPFLDAVTAGLARAQRTGRILRRSGAAPDHPVHPMLPETAYLKAVTLQLD